MFIPTKLNDIHQRVKLYIDIFYVNSLVFLATISDNIHYVAIDNIKNKKAPTLIKYIKNVIKKYTSRGFTIMDIFGDREFDVNDIISGVLPSTLHTCLADKHIHRIKKTIRTIKERDRTVCHLLPYKSFPKLLSTSLMKNVARRLNQFPNPNKILDRYIPANVMDGFPNPD